MSPVHRTDPGLKCENIYAGGEMIAWKMNGEFDVFAELDSESNSIERKV
tara:strand:- start:112 stop:258 length:147 start_codon:yes stop_codon:yes gene_type:complete